MNLLWGQFLQTPSNPDLKLTDFCDPHNLLEELFVLNPPFFSPMPFYDAWGTASPTFTYNKSPLRFC